MGLQSCNQWCTQSRFMELGLKLAVLSTSELIAGVKGMKVKPNSEFNGLQN